MRTLLPDPPPPEFEDLLERRRERGLDRRDEVWAGVVHVNPLPHLRHGLLVAQLLTILGAVSREPGLTAIADFNLGEATDFRGPDAGLLRDATARLYAPTAALVVEVRSPNDESWEKLPFYAARGVDEVLIVDPEERTVHWLARAGDDYTPIERSELIDLGAAQLRQRLDWPD